VPTVELPASSLPIVNDPAISSEPLFAPVVFAMAPRVADTPAARET
jgi:hypothetical protein